MLLKNNPQPHYSSTEFNKDTDFVFPSFEQIKGSQVFVSLKKPAACNSTKKQLTQENASQASKNKKQFQKEEKKTIERTIKQLLKGKQQLANYLESQKQFIQGLDVHDQQLRHRSQNRGKLASSLTQKKKSRTDTYTSANKGIYSHLSKVSRNGRILIAKSEALTMEVVKKQGESCQQGLGPAFQKRQYETVSFNDLSSEENEDHQDCGKTDFGKQQRYKKQEKYSHYFQVSSKQNYHPGQQCFVMTSPKKKQLKLNQKTKFQHKSFYATKYGLTHFSPWAFPKNQYDTQLCQNSSVLQDKKINDEKVFREKLMNYQEKPTINETKIAIKKKQSSRNRNIKKSVGNSDNKNSDNLKEKQNNEKQTIYIGSQRRQNCSIQQRYLSLEQKKDSKNGLNGESNIKVVKSSQVMVLQSETVNTPEIFASKEQAKQMFYPRKSLKFESNQVGRNSVSIEAKVFQTDVKVEQRQKDMALLKQAESNGYVEEGCLNELTKESQLDELKKTEQFLKQIILTKNSVSYTNSRSISKKEFKQVNQATYQEKSLKRSNVFITKNLLQPRVNLIKSPKKNQVFTLFVQDENESDYKVFDKNLVNERQNLNESDCFLVDKQNRKNSQSDTKMKAKTSLDNPLSDKTINEFIQKSNTKCLTEASLNGFYLINESKIRNTRNSFVRRKRHSMMVKKKASQDRKSNDQTNQRRLSYSIEKQLPSANIYDMSILEESKGFGIVNPLTKQLYKKYVSIVQNKR